MIGKKYLVPTQAQGLASFIKLSSFSALLVIYMPSIFIKLSIQLKRDLHPNLLQTVLHQYTAHKAWLQHSTCQWQHQTVLQMLFLELDTIDFVNVNLSPVRDKQNIVTVN